MTYAEFKSKVTELTDKYFFDFDLIGVRFEDKERVVGEIITDRSKSNIDREDDREFPEYGTEEYEEMEDLDGVSAWNTENEYGWGSSYGSEDRDANKLFTSEHCYLLGSSRGDSGEDCNEIIMDDAKVLEVLF